MGRLGGSASRVLAWPLTTAQCSGVLPAVSPAPGPASRTSSSTAARLPEMTARWSGESPSSSLAASSAGPAAAISRASPAAPSPSWPDSFELCTPARLPPPRTRSAASWRYPGPSSPPPSAWRLPTTAAAQPTVRKLDCTTADLLLLIINTGSGLPPASLYCNAQSTEAAAGIITLDTARQQGGPATNITRCCDGQH